jgi:hypothetical protein
MRRPPAAYFERPRRRARLRRCSWLALATAVLVRVAPAAAASVAIVQPAHDTRELGEALSRLKGELLALGLEVVLVERQSPASAGGEEHAWVERTAIERKLDALLEVVGDERPIRVDVWLREPGAGTLDVTHVEPEPTAQDIAESLAIHASEVLRSSFLAAELPPPQRPTPRLPEADRAELLRRSARRRLGFELGATLLTGLHGVRPALLPVLRLDLALDSRLALHATGAGFGTTSTLETQAGSVRVAQQFGVVGLCLCPTAASVEPMVGLATGVLRTAIEGDARPPALAHRARSVAFLLEASAGARVAIGSRYFVTLSGQVQLTEPSAEIVVVDVVAATTGRPNLLVTLTAGAWP